MKTKLSTIISIALFMFAASCKKPKTEPPVEEPIQEEPTELITTFKLVLKDSATNLETSYLFKDPDGDGGIPAFYGPGTNSSSSQTDSVINLIANKTYYCEVVLVDESKSPIVSVSLEVSKEGKDHMFFYNNGNNSILNAENPYTVKLNGSGIRITYEDLDRGSPQRNIGIRTRWMTYSATNTKYPLNIALRHQPDAKNGSYGPGETDISVDFKLMVN